jgi:hypothetical protein
MKECGALKERAYEKRGEMMGLRGERSPERQNKENIDN